MTTDTPQIPIAQRIQALADQRRHILTLTPEAALKAITDAPEPAPLVHSIPEQDLYLLIQDIGVRDALPLLTLASNRQWDYILDMEVWDRDRIDMQRTSLWLDLLSRADPGRLVKWSTAQKTEWVEFYLHHTIDVILRHHDQDPSDFGEGYFTLDNVFYIRLRPTTPHVAPEEGAPQEAALRPRQEVLLDYLKRLAAEDHLRYQSILLEAASLLPAETEESAYRWRNVSMAEKGFLPFEEAVGIYQPLTPEEFDKRGGATVGPPPDDTAPRYPAKMLVSQGHFVSALQALETESQRERLQVELAALVNRLAVADQVRIRSRADLGRIVEKACGYLNIGLEDLAADDAGRAAVLLGHSLQDLFRVGYGAALKLKWRAQRWLKESWFASQGFGLGFWDENGLGLLGGLLIKKPLFFTPDSGAELYREFADLAEITATAYALGEIRSLDHLLARMDLEAVPRPDDGFITYKNLLLTLWSRDCLALEPVLKPVPLNAFIDFWRDLWTRGASPPAIDPGMRKRFFDWVCQRADLPAKEVLATCGPALEALLAEVEAEYGAVTAQHLDPRHIPHFLLDRKGAF